jgi:hypothetical protein
MSDFLALTFRQAVGIWRVRARVIDRQERAIAFLATCYANYHRAEGIFPWTSEQLFPPLSARESAHNEQGGSPLCKQTEEQKMWNLMTWTMAYKAIREQSKNGG